MNRGCSVTHQTHQRTREEAYSRRVGEREEWRADGSRWKQRRAEQSSKMERSKAGRQSRRGLSSAVENRRDALEACGRALEMTFLGSGGAVEAYI